MSGVRVAALMHEVVREQNGSWMIGSCVTVLALLFIHICMSSVAMTGSACGGGQLQSGGYHTHDPRASQMFTNLHIEIKGYHCSHYQSNISHLVSLLGRCGDCLQQIVIAPQILLCWMCQSSSGYCESAQCAFNCHEKSSCDTTSLLTSHLVTLLGRCVNHI